MQVRFMRKIYEKAKGVIAWLGEPSMESAAAMKFLDRPMSRITSVQRASAEERSALAEFFDNPYWRRAWIIQEVAAGSSVAILCGSLELNWEQLVAVDRINPTFKSAGWQHVNQVRSFRHTYQEGKRIGLLEAMKWSQAAETTDPRDKIYSLLGLSDDGDDLVQYPNYRQPIHEVLRDFTRAVMNSKRSLDYLFLRSPQTPTPVELSSWTVDWVGSWSDPTDFFNANISFRSNFSLKDAPDPDMLSVQGDFLFGISSLSSAFDEILEAPVESVRSLGSCCADSDNIRHDIQACLSLRTIWDPSSMECLHEETFSTIYGGK